VTPFSQSQLDQPISLDQRIQPSRDCCDDAMIVAQLAVGGRHGMRR